MPKNIHTPIIPNKHDYNVEECLLQAQALNLALWTSSDVHEQLKPAFQLMDNLLNHVAVGLNNMPQKNKGGQCHDS